jgi:hypothetical protein
MNQMDNKQEHKPSQQNQNPGQKPSQQQQQGGQKPGQQQGGGQKPGQEKQTDDIHPESADQGNRNTDYSGGP